MRGDAFDKVAEVTNSASGSGAFISSGPLSVALHACKYYIIGVVVQGTFTRYYQSASALPFVSFGQQLGSQLVSGSTAPLQTYGSGSSSIHFYQRLSTAKP